MDHRDSLFPTLKHLTAQDNIRTPAGDRIYREEILALVLRHCKEVAQRTALATVTKAVVALPAWYTSLDCEAVRVAARLAGFAVQLVNEQVAAAIAYAYECEEFERGYTLVADLGAGAFNVAVVLVEGHQNTHNFVISAIGGKNHLGGDAFTARLADHVGKLTNLPPGGLRAAGQKAIRLLANGESYSIEVDDRPFEFTRDVVLDACQPLLQEIRDTIQSTLDSINLPRDKLASALLIGGASPTTGFEDAVTEVIGRRASIVHLFNRPELVACGAVHVGYGRAKPAPVLCRSIQLQVKDQVLQLGRQNEPLPTSHHGEIHTTIDNHESITIKVYEMDGSNPLLLQKFSVRPLPSGPVQLQVTVWIDSDGTREITVKATIQQVTKLVTSPTFTEEELGRMGLETNRRYSTLHPR